MWSNVKPVKVNLITGFLGTGKTTAIFSAIKALPEERVAVIVNEFGQTGVDGAVLESAGAVAVSEVAGGCMCCVTFVPLQIALNQLITKVKPDRILMEPSGLGHPARVLSMLLNDYKPGVLDVRATVALADPRHFVQQRYREHETYADQLALAEVLVFNKADLCEPELVCRCVEEAKNFYPPKEVVAPVVQGALKAEWLNIDSYVHVREKRKSLLTPPRSHQQVIEQEELEIPAPEPGMPVIRSGSNYGMHECGAIFHPEDVFDRAHLRILFGAANAPVRAKGVFRTAYGWLIFQRTDDGAVTEQPTTRIRDSRAEAIDPNAQKAEMFIASLILPAV